MNIKQPKIRFKGFNDSWEQRKLGDLVEFSKGTGYSKNDLTKTGIPIILYGRLYTNYETVISDVDTYVNEKKSSVYSEGEEVIVPSSGETAEDIAIASVVKKRGIIIGGDLNILKPKKEIDSTFLALTISNGYTKKELSKKAQGKSVVHLRNKDIGDINIFYPELREQVSISNQITNLDNLITLHQRKCDKLNLLKKSMLEKMFPKNGKKVPEIRFEGFTGEWEQRKLGDLGKTYSSLSGKTKEDFGHGDAKYITYMNVFSNPISDINMTEKIEYDQKQNEVKIGDVFFTTSSETPEEVGMSSVLLETEGTTYLNSFCFGYRPIENFDNYFLAYLLRSEVIRRKIIFLAQGISRYNISKNKMMEIEIVFPDMEEQKKIGKCLYDLDNLITLHQHKLETLEELKKSMLEYMFI